LLVEGHRPPFILQHDFCRLHTRKRHAGEEARGSEQPQPTTGNWFHGCQSLLEQRGAQTKITAAAKRLTGQALAGILGVMNFHFRFIVGASLLLATGQLAVSGADNPKTITLFNGKDLTGWKGAGRNTNRWVVGKAVMDPAEPAKLKVAGPGDELISTNSHDANLCSEAVFGDCVLDLEYLVGKSTPGNGIDSNSGVKMMNIYEIQIFDNYGKAVLDIHDCGAVYGENAPLLNACKPPGQWQRLVIDFRAPLFDAAGNKTANAKFVKVTLNGKVVQENVEIAHGTNVSRTAKEHPTGPIHLQGDHGCVAFRNIKVTPLN
jgi:hypothetical protein